MLNLRLVLIGFLGVAGFILSAPIQVPTASAADPVKVEIIALQHWPVQNALGSVRDVLSKYESQINVTEVDAESKEGISRLSSVGIKGHMPILILVNGKYRFIKSSGEEVAFVGFPSGGVNPLGSDESWAAADLDAILAKKGQ